MSYRFTTEVEKKNSQEAYGIQFAPYKQFCDDTIVEKKRLIKEANEKIEVLKADIAKYFSDAAILKEEIAGDGRFKSPSSQIFGFILNVSYSIDRLSTY